MREVTKDKRGRSCRVTEVNSVDSLGTYTSTKFEDDGDSSGRD